MPKGAILQTSKNSEVLDKCKSEHISELSSMTMAFEDFRNVVKFFSLIIPEMPLRSTCFYTRSVRLLRKSLKCKFTGWLELGV